MHHTFTGTSDKDGWEQVLRLLINDVLNYIENPTLDAKEKDYFFILVEVLGLFHIKLSISFNEDYYSQEAPYMVIEKGTISQWLPQLKIPEEREYISTSLLEQVKHSYTKIFFYGLHIKKAKPTFLYLRNKWEQNVYTFNDEHKARCVLEIFNIFQIFRTETTPPNAKRGGYITRKVVENGLQINDGELFFFFYGTKPHTYDKKTASIKEWSPDEYSSVETPENLDTLEPQELLTTAEQIYEKLFSKGGS